MKKREDRSRSAPPADAPRAGSPFAQLESLRQVLPASPAPAPAAVSPPKPRGPARAVVRLERKGRGGKEATVVEKLELSAQELEVWLTALKNALGCGGVREDGALVLQGDQRARLLALLEKRGVRRVTVS